MVLPSACIPTDQNERVRDRGFVDKHITRAIAFIVVKNGYRRTVIFRFNRW